MRTLLLASAIFFSTLCGFDKVVIWGHKLHSHTHSYIHNAFYRAFKHLGYQTYWFDNKDNVKDFDFSNSLFLTEGQVDEAIPLRDDCRYILHNCDQKKYLPFLEKGHCIILQVYTDDVLPRQTVKIAPCIHYDVSEKIVYMPWATDLLPDEIDAIKAKVKNVIKVPYVYWIGSWTNGTFGNNSEISPFKKACLKNNIQFESKMKISVDENIDLIMKSYMAPTIVGEWQKKVGYIPCRIFKNISYGQMGITNSERVYELFEKKIVYNPNTYQLFYDAKQRLKTFTLDDLYGQMDFVKTKHTYLNRIATLLDFLKLVEDQHANTK